MTTSPSSPSRGLEWRPRSGEEQGAWPPWSEAPARTGAALSVREAQVLRLLARGYSNHEIARGMCISRDTVKYHLKNLYGKLGARRRTEALLVAGRAGLLADAFAAA